MILPYNWIITALRGNPKAGRQEAGNQATRQAEAPTPGQPASQLVGWLFGGFGWRLGRCWGRSQILHNHRDSAIGRVVGIVRMTQLAIGKAAHLGHLFRSEEHTSELQSPCNL